MGIRPETVIAAAKCAEKLVGFRWKSRLQLRKTLWPFSLRLAGLHGYKHDPVSLFRFEMTRTRQPERFSPPRPLFSEFPFDSGKYGTAVTGKELALINPAGIVDDSVGGGMGFICKVFQLEEP